MTHSGYDRFPVVVVPNADGQAVVGWMDLADDIRRRQAESGGRLVVALEMYSGVDDRAVMDLCHAVGFEQLWSARQALKPFDEREGLVEPYLGGDDPVFGVLCPLEIGAFFDAEGIARLQDAVASATGLCAVWGEGASLVCEPDCVVFFDMPRWEGQLRQRRGEAGNLWADNAGSAPAQLYKRGFFVDWRILDRHKAALISRIDWWVDTVAAEAKAVEGAAFRAGLKHAATRPIRLAPFFDPGPWGGQWMREVCGLPDGPPNYAWCFDCVPEENSLLLQFGDVAVESPAMNLVLSQPNALMGEGVVGVFGREFPIRFDLLDTMDGGNLSLQVHPTVPYIREQFGMHYTQDESYYLLDAGPEGKVYLGLREDADVEEFWSELAKAQADGSEFDADRFAAIWPAKKHDHFLIPSGTLHCSGRDAMVLEISATPYIFTFKLWDWGRLGLDGRPRPINLAHGRRVLDESRRASWVEKELINRREAVADGDWGLVERTGLHRLEFIDTWRYRLNGPTLVEGGGTVHVMNVVEGPACRVTSPTGGFEPFVARYAETFVLPAGAGDFVLEPFDGPACAVLRANVNVDRATALLNPA